MGSSSDENGTLSDLAQRRNRADSSSNSTATSSCPSDSPDTISSDAPSLANISGSTAKALVDITRSFEASSTPPDSPDILWSDLRQSHCDDSSVTVFGDLPPSNSDGIAKALVENALSAFDAACGAYWAGHPGPYILEGRWSLATFEALTTKLESKWRPGFYQGQIVLYGDPAGVHEEVTNLFSKEVELGVGWDSHPETPDILKGFRSLPYLLANMGACTQKWMLTSSSSSLYCKEADGLFVAPTAIHEENGLAIEIAHGNESFPKLCREVINWTTGDGNRVLLAVGLKINTKSPHHRDPQLRLVVRDCTPSSQSINCKVYNFGNGSNVARRKVPRTGPPTPVRVASHQLAEGCMKQNIVPTNQETDELILELPIGAALFYHLQHDAFTEQFGLVLADSYVQDLKAKKWILDLGYIRNRICEIIAKDVIQSRTTQEGVDGEEEEEEEWSEGDEDDGM